MRVRHATPTDAEAIAGLWLEAAEYYVAILPDDFVTPAATGLAESFARLLGTSSPNALALVADAGHEIAGFLGARLVEPADDWQFEMQPELREIRLEIDFVATRQSEQRSGVASQLVEHAEQWGRSHGATVAVCDTHHLSPKSLPFWQGRRGYQPRSVRLRRRLD